MKKRVLKKIVGTTVEEGAKKTDDLNFSPRDQMKADETGRA